MEDSGPSCLRAARTTPRTPPPTRGLPCPAFSSSPRSAWAPPRWWCSSCSVRTTRDTRYYDVREKESKSWVDVFDGGRCRFDFIGVRTAAWSTRKTALLGRAIRRPKADRTRTCSAARRVRSAVAPTGASARSARTSQISPTRMQRGRRSSRRGWSRGVSVTVKYEEGECTASASARNHERAGPQRRRFLGLRHRLRGLLHGRWVHATRIGLPVGEVRRVHQRLRWRGAPVRVPGRRRPVRERWRSESCRPTMRAGRSRVLHTPISCSRRSAGWPPGCVDLGLGHPRRAARAPLPGRASKTWSRPAQYPVSRPCSHGTGREGDLMQRWCFALGVLAAGVALGLSGCFQPECEARLARAHHPTRALLPTAVPQPDVGVVRLMPMHFSVPTRAVDSSEQPAS